MKAKKLRLGCWPRAVTSASNASSAAFPISTGRRLGRLRLCQLGLRVGAGGAEHLLQVLGCFAGLAGVGFVDDHRVAPRRKRPHLVEDERELLQGGDDDAGLLTGERLGELGGVDVDLLHDSVGVFELVDGVLELAVENHPVGDHHHLVEHLHVPGVEARQPVGEPSDRVRLARPGRMLHQIRVTGAFAPCRVLELAHGVPLVESGEDHRRRLLRSFGGGFNVDESGEDVEPGVFLPHRLPQVGAAMPFRVGRVPGTESVTPVEGQEDGLFPVEAGGHEHLLGVDGEMDQRPAQRQVLRVTVGSVLGLGVIDRLAGEVVLHLGGGHRDAVDEQAEIDGLVGTRLIGELTGDGQPVGGVPLGQQRVEPGGGTEEGEGELGLLVSGIHHAVTQHVHGASGVQLLAQPVEEGGPGGCRVVAVGLQHLGPLVGLGRLR